MSNIWLVTGAPGVGKSSVISRVLVKLKSRGVIVGGCVTAERRLKGERVGFTIEDLTNGVKGTLAGTTGVLGPKVGRYRVSLVDLARVAAKGIFDAVSSSELVVIDELGPMELVSPDFRRAVKSCIDSGKPLLAVVHQNMQDDLLLELRHNAEVIVTVSLTNRDGVADELAPLLLMRLVPPKPS